jgi:hypothetical protein
MPKAAPAAELPPLPPAVTALREALAELDHLAGRLDAAERAVPVAEDQAAVAQRAADECDVLAALGRRAPGEAERRRLEARQAAEAVAAARRTATALRAAHARAEAAAAALADEAGGAHAEWTRARLAELGEAWRAAVAPVVGLARLAAALREAGGMLPATDRVRLPADYPSDALGDTLELAGERAPQPPPSPALDAAREASRSIRRGERLAAELDRKRPAA